MIELEMALDYGIVIAVVLAILMAKTIIDEWRR